MNKTYVGLSYLSFLSFLAFLHPPQTLWFMLCLFFLFFLIPGLKRRD